MTSDPLAFLLCCSFWIEWQIERGEMPPFWKGCDSSDTRADGSSPEGVQNVVPGCSLSCHRFSWPPGVAPSELRCRAGVGLVRGEAAAFLWLQWGVWRCLMSDSWVGGSAPEIGEECCPLSNIHLELYSTDTGIVLSYLSTYSCSWAKGIKRIVFASLQRRNCFLVIYFR